MRHQPLGYVWLNQVAPIVLGGGVVEGSGDLGEEAGAEEGGNRGGHDHHDVDHQQFLLAQARPRMDQSEQGIHQASEESQKKHCAHRAGP